MRSKDKAVSAMEDGGYSCRRQFQFITQAMMIIE